MEENKPEERHVLSGRKRGVVHNPNGRPKGSLSKTKSWKVEDRLRYKHKRNPLDELIKVADSLYMEKRYKEAGDIWKAILLHCEAPKKPLEGKDPKQSPSASLKAAEQTFDLLKELEKEHNANPGTEGSSNTAGMERGKTDMETDASPKEDLSDSTGQ